MYKVELYIDDVVNDEAMEDIIFDINSNLDWDKSGRLIQYDFVKVNYKEKKIEN